MSISVAFTLLSLTVILLVGAVVWEHIRVRDEIRDLRDTINRYPHLIAEVLIKEKNREKQMDDRVGADGDAGDGVVCGREERRR